MANLIDQDAVLAEIGEFQIRFNETGDSHERVAYASAEHCMLVIKAAPAVNRWIPCSERLPESVANRCIVFCQSDTVTDWVGFGHYEGADGWINLETGKPFEEWELKVTHWMPLPEPPKE